MGNALHIIGSFFLDIIETVVVSLAIFVVIYYLLFQPHQVKGASMEANFHDGEFILTDKLSYRFSAPERGDVVIFQSPTNPDQDFIKRVIALPGEKVKIEKGKVFVDGHQLDETYLPKQTIVSPGAFMREGMEIAVDQDNFFVLGDNRNHSSDSREWGTVPKKDIVGKAFLRYWPIGKLGLLPKVEYSSL